jgi:SRSO17 transposase
MKLTKRKGFNFFRSYFDVYNELDNDADKIAFIEAILDRQFLGLKPTELTGMAKFAYISQTNSIDSQVKGYEDKKRERLDGRTYYKDDKNPTKGVKSPPAYGDTEPPTKGVDLPPAGQVEE